MKIFLFFIIVSSFSIQTFSQFRNGNWYSNYQFSKPEGFNFNKLDTIPKKKNFVLNFNRNATDEEFETMINLGNKENYFIAQLVNPSRKKILPLKDLTLFMIQEAKDSLGNWQAVETFNPSDCGNSYSTVLELKKNHSIAIPIPIFDGDYQTELRLKLRIYDEVIYSEPYKGKIRYSQLNYLKSVRTLDEKIFTKYWEREFKRKGQILYSERK